MVKKSFCWGKGFFLSFSKLFWVVFVNTTQRQTVQFETRMRHLKKNELTLVVLILLPVAHIHPELSGSVLHSSPSRQGSISHHHFPITMEAVQRQETSVYEIHPNNLGTRLSSSTDVTAL